MTTFHYLWLAEEGGEKLPRPGKPHNSPGGEIIATAAKRGWRVVQREGEDGISEMGSW